MHHESNIIFQNEIENDVNGLLNKLMMGTFLFQFMMGLSLYLLFKKIDTKKRYNISPICGFIPFVNTKILYVDICKISMTKWVTLMLIPEILASIFFSFLLVSFLLGLYVKIQGSFKLGQMFNSTKRITNILFVFPVMDIIGYTIFAIDGRYNMKKECSSPLTLDPSKFVEI